MTARVRPITEFVYEMGRMPIVGILRDIGGQATDVVTRGADPSGVADSTAAINSVLDEGGSVLFPAGTFKTTGLHQLATNGQTIIGMGPGATTVDLAHATNDLFQWPGNTWDVRLGGFSITSSVVRTGGWVLRGPTASPGSGFIARSGFFDMDIKRQVNGIHVNQFEFVTLRDILMSSFVGSGGIGLKIGQPSVGAQNQGSECYLENVVVTNTDYVSVGATPLAIACQIEDCDAVYINRALFGASLTNNLKIIAGGYRCSNHFFNMLVADTTRDGHSMWVTGAGTVSDWQIINSWFGSAGQIAGGAAGVNGIRMDAGVIGRIVLSECNLGNSKGTGLYVDAPTNNAPVIVANSYFTLNGGGAQASNRDSMFFNVQAGALGPTLMGNVCGAVSGGVDIRTPAATSTRFIIIGNRFTSGTSYGVAPDVNLGNV
jgi:hypothetical protein